MTGEHPVRSLPDYDERLAAARRRAGYEIGDPTWADEILEAFNDPDRVDNDGEML